MINSGMCLYPSKVDVNATEVFMWFKKAADLGSSAGHLGLYRCYVKGIGVEKNTEEAFGHLQVAADMGHPEAMNFIGVTFSSLSEGDDEALSQAAEYFKLSADGGCSHGMVNMGFYHMKGRKVEKNEQKALEYFQKAVNLKNPHAVVHLINLYKTKRKIAKNIESLKFWENKKTELEGCEPIDNLKRRGFHIL
ncbi:hypothetical protein GEMRC1_010063 [Eukaryota sp. GEM-RC1]